MSTLQALSDFAQGYFWATVLAPVEWYLVKPVLIRLYKDAIYYINPLLAKITSHQLPVI